MRAARPLDGVTVQNLLLGLGTFLLVAAGVTFTAVAWSGLDAATQAALLVVATVAAAWLTGWVDRRGLRATAEAMSVVTLVLGAIDTIAIQRSIAPGAAPLDVAAIAAAALALFALFLGAVTGTRAPRAVASVVAQASVPLLVAAHGWSVPPGAGAMAVQTALVVVVLRWCADGASRPRSSDRVVVATATIAAASVWALSLTLTLVGLVRSPRADQWTWALVLASVAAVAVLVAALWADDRRWREPYLTVGAGLCFGAVAAALGSWLSGEALLLAMSAVAAGVVALGRLGAARWATTPRTVAAFVLAGLSLPALGAIVAAVGVPLEASRTLWTYSALDATTTLTAAAPAASVSGVWIAQLALVAAAWIAAGDRLGRRVGVTGALAIAGAGLAVVPVVSPMPVIAVVLTGLVALAALVVQFVSGRVTTGETAVLVLPAGVLLSWSLSSSVATTTLLAGLAVVAIGVAYTARRDDRAGAAGPAAGLALVAVAMTAGMVALVSGAAGPWTVATTACAFAGLGAVSLVLPAASGPADAAIARATFVVACVGHVTTALLSAEDTAALSAALLVGASATGLHAVRPERRDLALGWAACEGLVLVWLRLWMASVAVVEAYTLPLAAGLLALGFVLDDRRDGQASSWPAFGPGLLVGFVPSALVALEQPGSMRALALLVAAVAAVLVGVVTRRRSPVDVGAAVTVLIGAQLLAPVVAGMSTWITLGVCGAVLLVAGATYERRRRDLDRCREAYLALR